MRKLTSGNQKIFVIFSLIVFVIIVLLIYELFKFISISKQKYDVSKGMLFYDNDYNPIVLPEDGKVFQKWDKKYHLVLNDSNEDYILGNNGIGYNAGELLLNIYGNLYKINYDNTVEKYNNETIIKNLNKNAIYKLDDRKYLVVGRKIQNDTGTISTKNYLLVILDKAGNTLLLNNETSYKTINPIKIITSDFVFDVPNEKLLYNKSQDTIIEIDLKKVIGSSNEYIEKEKIEEENIVEENIVEEVLEEEEKEDTDTTLANNNGQVVQTVTSTGTTTTQTQIIAASGNGVIGQQVNDVQNASSNEQSSNNSSNSNNSNDSDNKSTTNTQQPVSNADKNKTKIVKSISLRQITPSSTYFDVDYYISDPENKYQSVYLEIEASNGYTNLVSLDKSKTTYRISNLDPNTEYKVALRYKEITSESKIEDFTEDVLSVTTLGINANIIVTKVSTDRIYFRFNMDHNYVFDSAVLNVYKDGQIVETMNVDISSSLQDEGWQYYIKRPSGYDTLNFRVENVVYEGKKINYITETKIKSY